MNVFWSASEQYLWLASHAVWQRGKERCHFISILWIRMDHIGLVRVISQFSIMAPCGYKVRWKYPWHCHYTQCPNENFAHFIHFPISWRRQTKDILFFHFDKVKHLNCVQLLVAVRSIILFFFCFRWKFDSTRNYTFFSVCCQFFFVCRCDSDFYSGNKF